MSNKTKRTMTKTVKLWAIRPGGVEISGHGHRAYGQHFDVPLDFAKVLLMAAPDRFSKDDPNKQEQVEIEEETS